MKTKSYDKQERMLSHHPPIRKLGMMVALLACGFSTLMLGMHSTVHADSSNEQRLSMNSSSSNLANSDGASGAKLVDNNSSSSDADAWKNSGGITFPHSYFQYQGSNAAIARNLGNIHNRLENKYLGKSALKFNVTNSNAQINVIYNNAMTYTSYQKDSNGNVQKKKQPITVGMRLNSFNFYPTDYWSGTPNVFVSKNFSKGIYYNGIKKMSAQYAYYDENGNSINIGDNGKLTVHGLNGVATPDGNFLSKQSNGKPRGENYNVQYRLIPFYYTGTWMQKHNDTAANNEKYFAGDSGLNKYKDELFDNNYDSYGKFVASTDGTPGTRGTDKYGKPQTTNNDFHVPGVGNAYTGYRNSAYSGDRNDNGHAVTFDISNRNQSNFVLGSSSGYGNFSLSSKTVLDSNNNNNNNNDNDNSDSNPGTPIQKSVNKKTIHRQGEDLTYTIKGRLPEKHETKDTWYTTAHYYDPVTVPTGKYSSTVIDEGYDYSVKHEKETNTHDSYNFSDTLPSATSITSVSSSGALNATNSGNTVSASANNNQMMANSGGSYTITVHAKADKLPQPSANGWSDDPKDDGYYTFSNKATSNYTQYSQPHSESSNTSNTKIKRYKGTVWHYDFDNNEDGDFDFLDHAPDGDGNFGYSDNFDEDQGVLKKDTVYGYENDTKKVDILNNAYKDNNPQWHYRYGYGDQSSETIKLNSNDDDGDATTQDFYFPYIVPRAQLTNSLITVDTDKKSNGLPFTLDMKGESYLYRNFSDYNDANVTINVTTPSGNVLWSQSRPLSSLLTEGQHAINWTQIKGNLDTGQLNVPNGAKIPLNVQVSSTNPQSIQQDKDDNTNTYGFTANNSQISSNTFGKQDNALSTSPEETLKYDGISEPRILSEMLAIHQPRLASGKTGYGLRQGNDLSLEYAGNINTKNYLNNGTIMNYDFPSAYNQANSGIDYGNDARNHQYNIPNQSNDQGNQTVQGGLSDRFNQNNSYDGNSYNKLNDNNGYDMSQLDSYNQMNSDDQSIVNSTEGDMPDNYTQYIQPSSFKTTYDFAPRITERDSGNVFLTQGTNDFLAHNRRQPNYNSIDAGQRMYTPIFMPLGKYDTYYTKADNDDSHRLGANFFDIDENRPTNFYGHMYLTAQSPGGTSDANDELSIQPIIAHQQNVQGFSNQENQWLKDQSGYFSK